MKKIVIAILLLCAVNINLAAETTAPEKSTIEINTIVAVVNETPILQDSLNLRVQTIEKQLEMRQIPLPSLDILKKQALHQLIIEQLQLQLAENRHIHVSSFQVTEQIQKIAEAQKITISELYQQVSQAGLTREAYRQQLQTQMIIHELVQTTLAVKINVTPQDITLYRQSQLAQNTAGKEYHVENIVIPLSSAPTTEQVSEAQRKATALLQEINAGKISFEQAALRDSAGESSLQGGDLDFRSLAELPEIYAEHLVHMQAGDIYGPLRAGNGIQLIKLVAIKDQQQQMTDAQIREALFKRKLEEAYPLWLSSLESQAFIQKN